MSCRGKTDRELRTIVMPTILSQIYTSKMLQFLDNLPLTSLLFNQFTVNPYIINVHCLSLHKSRNPKRDTISTCYQYLNDLSIANNASNLKKGVQRNS